MRIYDLRFTIYALMAGLLLAARAALPAEVGFRWSANSESDVAGYRIYWGPVSGVYTNSELIAGRLSTNCYVEVNGPQFFALSAVSSGGVMESAKTAELVYVPLQLVTERSVDGVMWTAVTTNEVAPLRPLEFFRERIGR